MLMSPHLATPFGKAVILEQVFALSERAKWVNTSGTKCVTHEGDKDVSDNMLLFSPSRNRDDFHHIHSSLSVNSGFG